MIARAPLILPWAVISKRNVKNSPGIKTTIFSPKESFMKLNVWIITTALIISLITPVFAWAEVKIAVVDLADVVFNSTEGKKAQAAMKNKDQELRKDLERRRDEFGKQVEEYQKQAPVMKEEARKKKEEEFGKRQAELQQKVGSSQQELSKLEEKEFKPLYDRFTKIVNELAKENKYTVVLDKRVVIGFDPSVDITDKVKAAFGK
jgi:outer membrane protein